MGILNPLHLHMNYKIRLSISSKKALGVFIVIVLDIQINLRHIAILTILSLIPDHGCPSIFQLSCSVMSDSATPWTAARQASLSLTNSQSLLKLMSIESVMPSNHLILCRPFLLLPSIFPSIGWSKYWSFSFNISPSNEHPGLISFRMNWLDLLAVQGTLKSLLQHHSSKASILRHSVFFIAQFSHPYNDHWKNHSLD